MKKIDYEKALNSSQYEAVSQKEGPILLIAGAGSGKTRTLVYKVAKLVESGVAPENILLLTFTRKAASEMLFRGSLLLDDRCSKVSGGTFHSAGNLLLRRNGYHIGINPNYTIMDSADARDCIGLLKNQKGYSDKNKKKFLRNSTLMTIFSLAVNKREPIEFILAKQYPQSLDFLNEVIDLNNEYSGYKKKHNLMDYDDLLIYFKELLEIPEVREKTQGQYHYIMVDEYQDTNLLQGEIVALLGSGNQNVMAVGDPAQSIYSFRGANYHNIMEFERFFPGTKVIKLEENYRSTNKILDACNAIMKPALEKYSKELFTRTKEGHEIPFVVGNESSTDEAFFIADKVEEISSDLGVPLNEIAVLFRSSHHSFELELALNKRKLPFIKFGGFKFVETAHVKDVVSHIRVIANPLDSVSWSRMLQLLEGVGPKTAAKVFEQVQSSGNPFAFTRLKACSKYPTQFKTLEKLFAFLTSPGKPPIKIVEKLLDYYYPILESKYDDHPKRKRDLEQFLTIAAKYKNIELLLTDISLEPPNSAKNGNLVDPKKTQGEHLVLSTVHSAKGLEWDTVFIMGANETSFPSFYSMENDEDLEEERRLFYVAATRAKERLFFTYYANKKDRSGQYRYLPPSQFLSPLKGGGLVKKIGYWDF